MPRKGISPLIATVLLLGITISIAAMSGDYFVDIVSDVSEDTSDDAATVTDATNFRIEIMQAEINTVEEYFRTRVRNRGDRVLGNITITAYCEDEGPRAEQVEGLDQSEIKTIDIDTGCNVERTTAALEEYPVSTTTEQISTTDYGIWSQTSAEEFETVALESNNVFFTSISLAQAEDSVNDNGFTGSKTNLTEENGVLKLESK